jgi:hypothetical protein
MKKAIFVFILLILAGGTALFFGWVNVKPGYFGVAHSTLTGTVGYPLESGRIHWFWQKLIPKSFHLYLVERYPRSIVVETSHALPGSEQLQEFGNFDLVVATSLQYSIEYDAAVGLIEQGILDDFNEYFQNEVSVHLREAVSDFILENMARRSQNDQEITYRVLRSLRRSIDDRLTSLVRLYKLEEIDRNISFREIPQIDLYNDALNRYFEYLELVYQYKQEELDREAEFLSRVKESDVEIDRWEKYGELITKYPELLKLFYVEKLSDQADVLVLPQNEATGLPKMLEPWAPYGVAPPQDREQAKAPPAEEKPERDAGDSGSPTGMPAESAPEAAEGEAATGSIDDGASVDDTDRKWYESLQFWKRWDGDEAN